MLQAYRNVPVAKLDEIALVLVKLAQLAADVPEIRELDINPLLADHEQTIAVDFSKILETGDLRQGDTFSARDL